MPLKATELKKNVVLLHEGQLHLVLDTEHVKPGKGPAYVQAKMKNLESGTIKTHRLGSADKVEDVTIERATLQYLYDASGQGRGPFVFMDGETFEQTELNADVLTPEMSQWLKEGVSITISTYEGRPLAVELPPVVELEVTDTAGQARGATATNQLKDATLETGAKTRVPPFIEVGTVVRVDPSTGEYLGKA
ncbi:MAG: elongation factor P [Phycisphaeraceae bacterium]|nr:elongation factor P [Phycisphaeraceae bacterium]